MASSPAICSSHIILTPVASMHLLAARLTSLPIPSPGIKVTLWLNFQLPVFFIIVHYASGFYKAFLKPREWFYIQRILPGRAYNNASFNIHFYHILFFYLIRIAFYKRQAQVKGIPVKYPRETFGKHRITARVFKRQRRLFAR